jgi:preprotein translocase subunit SecG
LCRSNHPEVRPLQAYLNVVQIILSAILILVVLLQAKGSGFSGAFFSDSSAYRSRRGVEKTLFNFTVGLAVVFVLVSIVTVKFFS